MVREAQEGNVQAARLVIEQSGKLVKNVNITIDSPFEKFLKEVPNADDAEDAERGRIYIPQSLLEKHGVTESSILNGKQSSNFENAARELADRAWAHYKLSSEAIPKVNSRDLLVLEAMATIYWNLLQKMQKINFNVISDQRSKIRLGKLAKLALCVQTRIFIRFNGYRPVYAR